jgi:hypothetical protein
LRPPSLQGSLATISGERELPNAHLLVSDAKRATVYDVEPNTGAATEIGGAGGDEPAINWMTNATPNHARISATTGIA